MSTDFWWFFDALVVIIVVYVIYSNAKRGATKVLILGIGYLIATLAAVGVSGPLAEVLYNGVAVESDMAAIERVNKKVDFARTFCNVIDNHKLGFYSDVQEVKKRITGTDEKEIRKFADKLWNYMNWRNDWYTVLPEPDFEQELRVALTEHYGELLGKELPEYVRVCFEEKMASNPEQMNDLVVAYAKGASYSTNYVEETFVTEPTLEMLSIFSYFMIFSVVIVIAAFISSALCQGTHLRRSDWSG